MKRLLRISFNLAFFSFIPILSWFVLGFLVDKSLTNVFTLTYPMQFIYIMLKGIFGTGANICKEKDKNKDAVLSGMTVGIIVGLIIFGLIALNINSYITFMNMDINVYKEFAIYSVLQLYIQFVFALVLEKLYFEEKEKLANKHCVIFNLLNFITLVISGIIFKDKFKIVITTLSIIYTYVIILLIKSYRKFKFSCNILKYIKYDSITIIDGLIFFLIYLFGLSNALEYGEKFAIALNFIALITDTQWDSFDAISTVAKIDISKGKFNYIKHRNNAYKLLAILLSTTFLMFILLYKLYDVTLLLALVYLMVELVNFIIFPIYQLKTCYLQLEYSPVKITTNKIIANILRMLMSFIKSPFCTCIGQVSSLIYQCITIETIFNKNYIIRKDGEIVKIGGDQSERKEICT